MKRKLLVCISDRLSAFLAKGEIIERYYNPGDLFDEVHILMTNNDPITPDRVRKLAGRAELFLHRLPTGKALLLRSLGWRPSLLREWARPAVELARAIGPQLIRCHGNHLNGFAAVQIKKALGIPLLVSLHINPDEDLRARGESLARRLVARLSSRVEEITLRAADHIMPVYRPIVPYLQRLGISNFTVLYNVLNPVALKRKTAYEINGPLRIISVGRQFKAKNPENLIRAVARLPQMELTLIGNGPYHERLQKIAVDCGTADRVRFLPGVQNDQLCDLLAEHDIFAVHSEYWELSKCVLEALLTGLPVVVNRRKGLPVPELSEEFVYFVDNTMESYAEALVRLMNDVGLRAGLGRCGYAHAQERWAPAKTEKAIADVYRKFLPVADA